MSRKYVIGLDFGTKSGRALLVDVNNGEQIAQSISDYSNGVMDTIFYDGTPLDNGWALQHPLDYICVLEQTISSVLLESNISSSEIIGLSVDFTSCTVLPVDKNNVPLCTYEHFAKRPHAYVKLWKHHAAVSQTDRINELLETLKIADHPRFGGKVSSELMLPKVMQILEEDPEIYEAADCFLEAMDWISRVLTEKKYRSGSAAAYKAMWFEAEGYPSKDFFKALNPDLEHFVQEKLSGEICSVGRKFGELTEPWAKKLGLLPGTAVGTGIIDAHAALPGCGIMRPGQMMLALGTSSVQMVLNDKPYSGKGIMGGIMGGVIPGYYALESGLAGVGDIFEWFINNAVPCRYQETAKLEKINLYQYLGNLIKEKKPGETGLLALDWWNGNKTPFINSELSGIVLGYSMSTKPEEIYRTLLEAVGFGTLAIIEAFEMSGLIIDEVYACGGIAEKDPVFMQIVADITNREIIIAGSKQTAALGAAMYASVAAGSIRGGHDKITDAVQAMARCKDISYKPKSDYKEHYLVLYNIFKELSNFFGKSSIMQTLKALSR